MDVEFFIDSFLYMKSYFSLAAFKIYSLSFDSLTMM